MATGRSATTRAGRAAGRIVAAVILILSIAGATPVTAQAIPSQTRRPAEGEILAKKISPQTLALVKKLDDPDFSARESALQTLTEQTTDSAELYAVLQRIPLSAEQKMRVLTALGEVLDQPGGALGIQMNTAPGRLDHVRVTNLIEGMPAEKVLMVGDLITQIEGEPVRNADDLMRLVQNRDPGDTVIMNVQRAQWVDGQLVVDELGLPVMDDLRLSITLGSTDDLIGAGGRWTKVRNVQTEMNLALRQAMGDVEPVVVKGGVQTSPFFISQRLPQPTRDSIEVMTLRDQLATIERYNLQVDEFRWAEWVDVLERLRERANNATLSGEMRRYFHEQAEIFEGLLPDRSTVVERPEE